MKKRQAVKGVNEELRVVNFIVHEYRMSYKAIYSSKKLFLVNGLVN
jgi:hypothetical protein